MKPLLLQSAAAVYDVRVVAVALLASLFPAASSAFLGSGVASSGPWAYLSLSLVSLFCMSFGVLFTQRALREPLVASRQVAEASLVALPAFVAFGACFAVLNMLALSLQSAALSLVPPLAGFAARSLSVGLPEAVKFFAAALSLPFAIVPVVFFARLVALPLFLTDTGLSIPQALSSSLSLTRRRLWSIVVGFFLPLLACLLLLDLVAVSVGGVFEGGASAVASSLMSFLSYAVASAFGMVLWAGLSVSLEDRFHRAAPRQR